MLRSGVDLIEINRVQLAIHRFGDRFLGRVFTYTELRQCHGRTESLAARFAAKEAVAKALGTGIWRQHINWIDIEILRNVGTGAPTLHLHQAAAHQASALGLSEWSVSLSHDRTHAIAVAIAVGTT